MTPAIPGLHPAPTGHAGLLSWVSEVAALTQPDRVYWCDGSEAEWTAMTDDLSTTDPDAYEVEWDAILGFGVAMSGTETSLAIDFAMPIESPTEE